MVPVTFIEAQTHMTALMLVWSTMLGDLHPFVSAYGTFIKSFSGGDYAYIDHLKSLGQEDPPATLLLLYIQLWTVTY